MGFTLSGGPPIPVVFVLDDIGFGSFVEVAQNVGESVPDYHKRLGDEGVTQFRYAVQNDFEPAEVRIVFSADSWGDSNGNMEAGATYSYVVEGPSIRLVNPGDGASVDIGQLNAP